MVRRTASLAILILIAVLLPAAVQNDTPGMNRPGKGIVDVTIVDQDGKPLNGVTVSVPGYRSTTGLGGTARFGLLPGRYAVLAKKNGYRGKRVYAGVRPGETTKVRITLQKLPGTK